MPSGAAPETWSQRPAMLPKGWTGVTVDRLWVRGRPMRLTARQGEAARLEPI